MTTPPTPDRENEEPPTPEEWAAEEIARSPDLSEDQIMKLYRVYGIPYTPPEDS